MSVSAIIFATEKQVSNVVLEQGWANYCPRATCDPPEYIMRPVGTYMFARFLKFYSEYFIRIYGY